MEGMPKQESQESKPKTAMVSWEKAGSEVGTEAPVEVFVTRSDIDDDGNPVLYFKHENRAGAEEHHANWKDGRWIAPSY